MSKSLRNMTQEERKKAVQRRLIQEKKGLGYWASVDAQKYLGVLTKK